MKILLKSLGFLACYTELRIVIYPHAACDSHPSATVVPEL